MSVVLLVLPLALALADPSPRTLFGSLCGLLGAVFVLWLGPLGRRPGLPVTAFTQPALHALVRGVADGLGVRRRYDVRLVGEPTVEARVGRLRRELHIGLPLLAVLTRAELRALVGGALAILDRPDGELVAKLRRRWSVHLHENARDGLAPLAAELIPPLDAAAATAAGRADVAAWAFALQEAADLEYVLYLEDVATPPPRWWARAVIDLDEGWCARLAHGIDDPVWDRETAEQLAFAHPGLADEARLLGGRHMVLRTSDDPVEVLPLSVRQRRRLARVTLDIPATYLVVWCRIVDAPQAWWRRRARREADEYRLAAGTRSRAVDVLVLTVLADTSTPHELRHAATVLVEDALLHTGRRLEHPAVRGVLIGPDGERIDRKAIDEALAEPGYPTLRGWLQNEPC
ncbi:hypothetical protein [Virgisporangium aliadipatigenens]|uniref:hypothetical protein n=1 Tax=Virgisporangium aliadipatigenens TaxID=741659 RepID=UPI0019458B9E|nr:hypothetical protein [Virgisporangium aliadipatigenens]